MDAIVIAVVNALPKEARFSLGAPARPDRAMATETNQGAGQGHRTAPIDAQTARELSETAIERFDKSLGG